MPEFESNPGRSPSVTVIISSTEGCMNLKARKTLTALIQKF